MPPSMVRFSRHAILASQSDFVMLLPNGCSMYVWLSLWFSGCALRRLETMRIWQMLEMEGIGGPARSNPGT